MSEIDFFERRINGQSHYKTSKRAVEGGIRGLDTLGRDFADFVAQRQADEQVVVLVKDEVLTEFVPDKREPAPFTLIPPPRIFTMSPKNRDTKKRKGAALGALPHEIKG